MRAMRQARPRPPRGRALRLTGFGLTLPALLFVFAFMVYPIASLVILSVQNYAPLRSTVTTFAGLSNYAWLVGSDLVHQSIWVTVVFTAVSVAIEMAIGLAIAVLLARLVIELRSRSGRLLTGLLSSVFILPFATPAIAGAIAWKVLLHPQFGPVDAVLHTDIARFAQFPLASVLVADAWQMTPFVLFLMFAAILSFEPEQYQAPPPDAPNAWPEFPLLTLPLILPVVAVTAAFRACDAFTKIFDP